MMDEKEKQVVFYYLNNLVQKSFSKRKEGDILSWVENNSEDLFGIELECKWDKHGRKKYRLSLNHEDFAECDEEQMFARDMGTIRAILSGHKIKNIAAKAYDKGIDTIFDVFEIASDYQAILRYMIYCEKLPMMNDFTSNITSWHNSRLEYRFYAAIADVAHHIIEKCFSFDSPLVLKGIIEKDSDGDIKLSDSFRRLLHSKHNTKAEIRRAMLGETASATLTRNNFKYIEDEYDYIRAILSNAVKEQKAGMNILIYGIPGTGKTELCKTIAKDIESSLYMVSETAENDRGNRIFDLTLAQTLLADDKNAVILLDEAEDVFYASPFAQKKDSKLFFNRMLEKNKTPVIWISNDIRGMDAAYIRRFKYALEVRKPDQAATLEIWKNICAKHNVELPADMIAEYAKKYDIAPSFIDTAICAVNFAKSTDAIERTIDSLQKATFGFVPRKKDTEEVNFVPELLNTDTDLSDLAYRVVKKGSLKFSLCLYGAPGTGKSAFARHLAEKMGLKVIQKRASDLLSMWVGETEKNIAQAFNEAYATKSLLVFDEADSFLCDRKGAAHSWEVSQVNEMLTWMESHPYPFICTTNLMQNLDEASLRRFKFKVKYDFLKPEQVSLAFKHFFGDEAEVLLSHLTHLTPGDFAVVKSKQDILDTIDQSELVHMLELEQAAKGIRTTRLGFV
ncbi:MAG: ATP-binding protein [Betaproteobacteria bacterium]|nr:ATP-binding protein [Betaproteobacteria bacterium]